MEKRKHLIKGGLYMILIQLIVGGVGFFILYKNYDNITKSKSIKENYTETITLQTHNAATKVGDAGTGGNNPASGDVIYTGLIGSIHIGTKEIGGSEYQKKTIEYKDININPIVHDTIDILTQQAQTLTRDYNTVRYVIQQAQQDNFLQTSNDLNFLTKYTNNTTLTSPNYSPRIKLNQILETDDSNNIINYIQGLENNFVKIFATRKEKYGRNNSLLQSEKFAYIYNQLHVDSDNKYRNHITIAASIFNINPNLIKACIFVEQLRAFYTFKGLFKNVAQTNTYLTVMSKQSFGVGGMKLETASKLEERLQTNKSDLYQKYFAYENQNNIAQQRLARLTDTKNYYYQVLYSAGILYQYSTERRNAGYNIINKPGLLATMYNIGYSEPHANADIGGSFMTIEGDKYSFGGLAMLIYYYLEIYG